jgi:hypothetical protein
MGFSSLVSGTNQGSLMNDFDFLVGTFDLENRRLTKALAGCTEWEEFPSTAAGGVVLGGMGHMDEMSMPTKGYSGVTLRLYSAEREQWSLYWISSRNPVIESPVVGRFVDGVGTFYGDDTYEGRPIRVRFLWSNITANSSHWEQAFSDDGEKTWETNWVNDLTRRG